MSRRQHVVSGGACGFVVAAALLAVACASHGPAAGPAAQPRALEESMQVRPISPERPVGDLEIALASDSPEDRAKAAWELAGARAPTSGLLERLLQMSRHDADRRVREAAAWAYHHVETVSRSTGSTRAYEVAPSPIRAPRPLPPKDPRVARRSGDVVVDVLISETGEVVYALVSQSVPGLDEPAIECAKAWLFAPAQAGGKTVPSVARISVSFRAYR